MTIQPLQINNSLEWKENHITIKHTIKKNKHIKSALKDSNL